MYWRKNAVPRPLKHAYREIKRRVRAVVVKVEEKEPSITKEEPKKEEVTTIICTHCHTTQTPQWRRITLTGHLECNACNVYYRKHGSPRPLELANRRREGAKAVVKQVPMEYKPVVVLKSEKRLGRVTGNFDFEEFMRE